MLRTTELRALNQQRSLAGVEVSAYHRARTNKILGSLSGFRLRKPVERQSRPSLPDLAGSRPMTGLHLPAAPLSRPTGPVESFIARARSSLGSTRSAPLVLFLGHAAMLGWRGSRPWPGPLRSPARTRALARLGSSPNRLEQRRHLRRRRNGTGRAELTEIRRSSTASLQRHEDDLLRPNRRRYQVFMMERDGSDPEQDHWRRQFLDAA